MITTVYDNFELDYDEVLFYLRENDLIELGENQENNPNVKEKEIMRMFNAAKRKADNFIQREPDYFEADDELFIPEDVKNWVLKATAFLYERRVLAEGSRSIDGAESVDWTDFGFEGLHPYKNGKTFFG